MDMHQADAKHTISYLYIISEIIKHYKELHSQLDIVNLFGSDCLKDITKDAENQLFNSIIPLPENYDLSTYQFKESVNRNGEFDVIFHKGNLVNFRAQIFFNGLSANKEATEFITSKLRPLLSNVANIENFHHDSLSDTFHYDEFKGMIIAFRVFQGSEASSISTYLMDKANAYDFSLNKNLSTPQNNNSNQSLSEINLIYAEDAFKIAHDFVDLREALNREAGTAWSIIINLFHKVNYDYYYQRAMEIFMSCNEQKNRLHSFCETDNNSKLDDYKNALRDYLDALYIATDIFARKTNFIAKKSKSASTPETSFQEFQKIVKDENASLAISQATGDKLTIIYRDLLTKGQKPGGLYG